MLRSRGASPRNFTTGVPPPPIPRTSATVGPSASARRASRGSVRKRHAARQARCSRRTAATVRRARSSSAAATRASSAVWLRVFRVVLWLYRFIFFCFLSSSFTTLY